MSTIAAGAASPRSTGRLVSVAGALLLSLVAGYLSNWWAGLAVLALALVVVARPLDLFVSFLMVTGASVFAEYGDPHISRDLAIVLLLTVYCLVSLFVAWIRGRWSLPSSSLTSALTVLALTSTIAGVHGLLVHNPLRFLGVEMFALFTMLFALAVGGLPLRAADLRLARWTLIVVGLACSGIGYRYLALYGTRTQGLPFSPVPGFVALVVLSLMLFEPSPRPRLGPVLLFCVLMGHQVITFTRGYWLGLLAALPFLLVLYARFGAGSRPRWRKVLRTGGLVFLATLPVAILVSAWYGWSEVAGMLGSRFVSSFETRNTPETVSNVVRLVELRTSMNHIFASPWIGYGHGSQQIVRQFFHPETGPQWWVHQSYVMIWLKQGIFGLLALLGLLYVATRSGIDGAGDPDPLHAGWAAASAACTVFAAVVGLTNYYFFMVTQSYILALVWGITLAIGRPSGWRLVWRSPGGVRGGRPGAGA